MNLGSLLSSDRVMTEATLPQLLNSNTNIPIAIVGDRPNGDQSFVEHVVESILSQLMRPADEIEVVQMIELPLAF